MSENKETPVDEAKMLSGPEEMNLVVPSDRKMRKNLNALGLAFVSQTKLKEFAKLGVAFDGVGMMRVQGGMAVKGQLIVDQAMTILIKKLRKKEVTVEEAIGLANALGFSLGKLTDSQRFVMELNGVQKGAPPGPPQPKTPSFPDRHQCSNQHRLRQEGGCS